MHVDIFLLGRFAIVVDGRAVPDDAWERRQATSLVKLLALTPGRSLHREQVIDTVWPELSIEEAAPRLHKAAHYARKATGDRNAVVLRRDMVSLFPDTDVTIDVAAFEADAELAVRGDGAALERALTTYGGVLLPSDLYEEWADGRREQLRQLHVTLLRQAERWDDLLLEDAADEDAHLALMRAHVRRGDHRAALRQFERMDRMLRRELGMAPSAEATQLRDHALAALGDAIDDEPRAATSPFVGRDTELAALERRLDDGGRGHTVFVGGPPGIGKSALLAEFRRRAVARGWRAGLGVAASIEGAWPYAPVLEAFADLGRRHPTLLDGLRDEYRTEIDRALGGVDPTPSSAHPIGHQNLFVAATELVRLAAAGTGVVLIIDDAHDADDATLRLLHYLARSTAEERVVIVVGHRSGADAPRFDETRTSLIRRDAATAITLAPLDRRAAADLVAAFGADTPAERIEQLWEVSGGVPFALVEFARRGTADDASSVAAALASSVPRDTHGVMQRVAVSGMTFDTDEFLALAALPDDEAFEHLDIALAAQVVERTESGYRFRHALVRDALLRELAPHNQRRAHRDAAAHLERVGASPARVGHHLLQAGDPAAVPYLLRAAETEIALGAYRDALALVDAARPHARGEHLPRLLALHGDVLFAMGDPRAVTAFREALDFAAEEDRRIVRAKLAKAAVYGGDFQTAAAVLDGLEPDGGAADSTIMLAKAMHAYYMGNVDTALAISDDARQRVLHDAANWQLLDLVALRGLIAHNDGEWFDHLRLELRRIQHAPSLATSVFDGHLCVAELLLYGPVPYAEVVEMAASLRETAQRAGVLRAVAFADALAGEAALLAGDLERAEHELQNAADLHREIGATGGEAHCLQRLAEVRLAQGDRADAMALLRRALPLARFSAIAMHLLQRVYGTMIAAASTPDEAVEIVEFALDATAREDFCNFCEVMLELPAAIAYADAGNVDAAKAHLAIGEASASRWQGFAWRAAALEARAHVAHAEGKVEHAAVMLAEATAGFERAGQPLDALRCATPLR